MDIKQPSLRDLLKDTAPTSETSSDATATPTLPPTPSDPFLRGVLAQAQPLYVAARDGSLRFCSARFAALAPDLFRDGHSLAEICANVESADGEITLTEKLNQGVDRIFRSRHFPLKDETGRLIGVCGVYDDITALSRAARKASDMENWLQDVIRSTSDWVWSTDRNYNLVFISPRISDIVDQPAQSLTGRYLLSLGEFDADDKLSAHTRADMARHAPFRNRIFLITATSGRTHRIHLSGVPVFDEDTGQFSGYRGTGTDVTGRFEVDAAMNAARNRLEETFEELRRRNDELRIALEKSKVAKNAKDEFLATMGHELKTPLNSIIGFSDAASQGIHGPLNESYAGYFNNIHKAGVHLLSIINDVLEAASVDQQNIAIEKTKLSVKNVVNEAVALSGADTRQGQVDVTELQVDNDCWVWADRIRLRQILVNLIGNAVKFTPPGGRVGIDLEPVLGDAVAITVWDTGVGIPVTEQSRVFDKFYRVERATSHGNGEGTGLGLAISRHLAQLMGGDLTLASIPGQGSRFTLTLPAPAK